MANFVSQQIEQMDGFVLFADERKGAGEPEAEEEECSLSAL